MTACHFMIMFATVQTYESRLPDIDMQRIRRYFSAFAVLTVFLLGTWMSHATVAAMPLGTPPAALPSISMSEMPCCLGSHGMDMSAQACAMSGPCMSVCAEAHAPRGLRLSGVNVPAAMITGPVIFLRPVGFRLAVSPFFYAHPPYQPPPLEHMRLVI